MANYLPHPDLLFKPYHSKFLKSSIWNLSMKSLVPVIFTWPLKTDRSLTSICQSSPEIPSLNVLATIWKISTSILSFFLSHPAHPPKNPHLYQHKSEEKNNQEVYISSQTQNIWLQPASHSEWDQRLSLPQNIQNTPITIYKNIEVFFPSGLTQN